MLYIATEEGYSKTLQQKIVDFGINETDKVLVSDVRTKPEIIKKSKGKDFVFIDSINFAHLEVEDIEDIKRACPTTAFISIHQSTKEGDFRGGQQFAHNCDVIVQVDKGVATSQGRFNGGGEYQIFS